MKEVSLSVVLFYVLYCCLGKEHLTAARILKRSPQPLKDIMEMFNKTESSKASGFQSTVRPVIVTDFYAGGHHLAEVFEDTNTSEAVGCNLIGSKEIIERVLKIIPPERVKNMSKEEMDEFIDKCNDKEPTEEGSSLLDILGDAFSSLLIFPGTKWCGPGDVAKNYDDLGSASRTDSCCREHDHSGDSIPAYGTKHNLTNYLPYTMTECVYDRKFFNCLQNVSSFPSVTVGTLFFDVLKTRCFEYGHPTKCTKRDFWRIFLLKDPCVKKEPDTSKPKEWHIESPPSFLEKFIEEKKQKKPTFRSDGHFTGNRLPGHPLWKEWVERRSMPAWTRPLDFLRGGLAHLAHQVGQLTPVAKLLSGIVWLQGRCCHVHLKGTACLSALHTTGLVVRRQRLTDTTAKAT